MRVEPAEVKRPALEAVRGKVEAGEAVVVLSVSLLLRRRADVEG